MDALRALFTELEFTSLLKELLPVVEVSETHYTEAKSAADVESVVKAIAAGGALAVAVGARRAGCREREEEEKEEEPQDAQMSFMGGMAHGDCRAARAHRPSRCDLCGSRNRD